MQDNDKLLHYNSPKIVRNGQKKMSVILLSVVCKVNVDHGLLL